MSVHTNNRATGPHDHAGHDWQAFWAYDSDRLTLTEPGGYRISLETLTTSARTLNTIFQVRYKPWCDPMAAGMFLAALEELLMPQACLCSWGEERGPIDVAAIIGQKAPIT